MAIECPVCNSQMRDWQHHYFDFAVIRCRQCGFIRAKDIPSEKDLLYRYKTYTYRDESIPDSITIKRYEQLLTRFEKYRKTNNILDYGCGEGHFISIAKSKNWNSFGFEISEKAIEMANNKGLSILNTDDLEIYKETFDVITCMEVIEHVHDVKETTNLLFSLLREGGCIYITTPNIKSLSLRYLKDRGTVIAYPEHLSYFSTRSVGYLFKGISCIKSIKTTGIQPFLRISNIHQITTQTKSINTLTEKRISLKILKVFVNSLLSLFKVGDTIKIKAEKCQIK